MAEYENGTVKVPLFAKKSQIAHELGHYVGDKGISNPNMVRGAFNTSYEYAPGAPTELNAAEHFADHFKTKLGYPYKGKEIDLLRRQDALNGETFFDNVYRPDGK